MTNCMVIGFSALVANRQNSYKKPSQESLKWLTFFFFFFNKMEQTPGFPKGRNSPCVEHKMGGEGNRQGVSFQTDLFYTFIEMKTWHTKPKKKKYL